MIYFDNSATTPLDPRVLDEMVRCMRTEYGNPSSLHVMGRQARASVEEARQRVAQLISASPEEIIFTGSGTEADNIALLGIARQFQSGDLHVITSAFEHPAVLETFKHLAHEGVSVTYLAPNSDGIVEPDTLRRVITKQTRLISIMTANNVVGTIQPISEMAAIAKERGIWFHTDAVQAAGKIPLRDCDLISISAHKIHGPKGVGALCIRKTGTALLSSVFGGGQERGLRSGTENVTGIVGFGRAALDAVAEMSADNVRLIGYRDQIINECSQRIPNLYLIGHRYRRLPGHICFGLSGQEGEAINLLLELDQRGIAVSSGSACSAHHMEKPSYVLTAMGYDPIKARGSLRITLGRLNTEEEVRTFIDTFCEVVSKLRKTAF